MRLASLVKGIDLSTVLSSESILMYIMRQLLFLTMTRELLLMWLYVNMTCNQCGNPWRSWCHSFVIKAWRLRKQKGKLSVSIMEKNHKTVKYDRTSIHPFSVHFRVMGGGLEHFSDVVGQGMAWAGRLNVCILENIHKRYYKSNFLICPHA